MSTNLIEMAQAYLTPDVVSKLSSFVGENPANVQNASAAAIPAVLAGLLHKATSTPTGASGLMSMLTSGKFDAGSLTNISSLLSGSGTDTLLKSGSGVISSLFGDTSSGVANVISRFSGVSATGASSILSAVAPLVMGILGGHVAKQGLGASGLKDLLLSNKEQIAKAAPPGLATALGLGSLTNLGATLEAPKAIGVVPEPKSKLIWWLLGLAALVILGLLFYRSCGTPTVAGLKTITLCGTTLSLEEAGLNYRLATYLGSGSDSELPKRFVFERLNFDTSSATLMPDSQTTVNNLIAILKCYPNAQVRLEGYTDNTGDPEANRKLSLDRATTVKNLLVQGGVDAGRIDAQGLGQDNPVGPNDTDEGRAKNRRTELIVTKK